MVHLRWNRCIAMYPTATSGGITITMFWFKKQYCQLNYWELLRTFGERAQLESSRLCSQIQSTPACSSRTSSSFISSSGQKLKLLLLLIRASGYRRNRTRSILDFGGGHHTTPPVSCSEKRQNIALYLILMNFFQRMVVNYCPIDFSMMVFNYRAK